MECGSVCAIRYEDPHCVAVPIRCKSWGCETCQPIRKRQLVAQALAGGPVTFLTLTSRYDKTKDPNTEACKMSHAFAKLVKRIRRRNQGQEFEYCAIFESTKNGWPHLHILTRTLWIPKGWLSETWHSLTGSYIVDIRRIQDPQNAARYVAKYVGKAPHHYEGTKRYRFSKNYRPPETWPPDLASTEKMEWQLVPAPLAAVKAAWHNLSIPLEYETPISVIGTPSPGLMARLFNPIQMNQPSLSYVLALATLVEIRPTPNPPDAQAPGPPE